MILKVLVFSDFNRKATRSSALIRQTRNYLLENIELSDALINSLLTLNCITEEQSQLIQGQRSRKEKNAKLLYCTGSLDQTESSNFVNCFRRNNQRTVASIVENGGGLAYNFLS